MKKPYHGFGDFFPDPYYWQNKTRTANIWHWPTKSVLYVERNDLWEYYFGEKVLNDLVDGWEVEINHCYPAWVDPTRGFWTYNADNEIVAQPGFNQTLERMAALRDAGKLNVTTICDFMDYQLATEQIQFEYLPDGRLKITNGGDQNIKGLSLVTSANFVLVNDERPLQKTVSDEIVFWFNLEADDSVLIRMID